MTYVYSKGHHQWNGIIKEVTLKEGFNYGKISDIITGILNRLGIIQFDVKKIVNREYGFAREDGKDMSDEDKMKDVESRLKRRIERHNIVVLFKLNNELYWGVYLCETSLPQDRVSIYNKIFELNPEQEKTMAKIYKDPLKKMTLLRVM